MENSEVYPGTVDLIEERKKHYNTTVKSTISKRLSKDTSQFNSKSMKARKIIKTQRL